jgi:hypothetical protein
MTLVDRDNARIVVLGLYASAGQALRISFLRMITVAPCHPRE